MEQKRFGVKINLLNELRLFQSMLLKKRKMVYDVDITGNAGTQTQVRIQTGENRVSIPLPGSTPLVFSVPRENYKDQSPTSVSLVVGGMFDFSIKFDSAAEKSAFKRDISFDWTPSPEREG